MVRDGHARCRHVQAHASAHLPRTHNDGWKCAAQVNGHWKVTFDRFVERGREDAGEERRRERRGLSTGKGESDPVESSQRKAVRERPLASEMRVPVRLSSQ